MHDVITSAMEAVFSLPFVCLFFSMITLYLINFHKIGGKVACGPWKKPIDFGGNLDHIMVGLELHLHHTAHGKICVNRHLSSNNNSETLLALAEVYALLECHCSCTCYLYFICTL